MENLMATAIRYTAYICIGYGLLTLAVYVLQRNLLYFPDRQKPTAEQLASVGLSFWPNESDYVGLVSAHASKIKGTVIVFHGNAGSALQRYYVAHALFPLGYRVILAEYPGYGGRAGTMSEKSFVADAKAVIAAARKDFGSPIYLFGESMGCAVAAAVADNPPGMIAGLILVTPWDCLADLAQTHYWYMPARWLVKDRFDSVKNLHAFTRPVAVAMADNDTVIPNKHTLRLYDTLNAPKRLWRFTNAGHNTWPTGAGERWWSETTGFITTSN
jgi:pimeloyl-ACP methyl ester carboxylesterase